MNRFLGNLSYGVFLAHFLGTVAMYWIAEYVFARTGLFGIFGIPDITDLRIHVSVFVFAILAGAFVYFVFERPFERLRARFRKRPSPAAVPVRAGSATDLPAAIESLTRSHLPGARTRFVLRGARRCSSTFGPTRETSTSA